MPSKLVLEGGDLESFDEEDVHFLAAAEIQPH